MLGQKDVKILLMGLHMSREAVLQKKDQYIILNYHLSTPLMQTNQKIRFTLLTVFLTPFLNYRIS